MRHHSGRAARHHHVVAHTRLPITNGAAGLAARHHAAELAPVRVNAISPGIIDSGAWDDKNGFLTGETFHLEGGKP
jgi:NAD(P)-dependent dehydrogenase (short-subunit alcohol dehydrogenase family)